ncbi:MAG: hypothetical protein N2111_10200, partial [Candidatus Sumerlaeaceae bacterium]|nr:hypothetical protein [Candidatus Sumerlaeaceae bacterium]
PKAVVAPALQAGSTGCETADQVEEPLFQSSGALTTPLAAEETADLNRHTVTLRFTATRDQIFRVFPAIANLADKSDDRRVTIVVEGRSTEGFSPSWLRNAVEEPFDEASVEIEPQQG